MLTRDLFAAANLLILHLLVKLCVFVSVFSRDNSRFRTGTAQIIIIILFAQIMSKQIHWRQYNGTVCEQDIPGSYEH